jgi:hypothetical protein
MYLGNNKDHVASKKKSHGPSENNLHYDEGSYLPRAMAL